jgi:hypothetical protein
MSTLSSNPDELLEQTLNAFPQLTADSSVELGKQYIAQWISELEKADQVVVSSVLKHLRDLQTILQEEMIDVVALSAAMQALSAATTAVADTLPPDEYQGPDDDTTSTGSAERPRRRKRRISSWSYILNYMMI